MAWAASFLAAGGIWTRRLRKEEERAQERRELSGVEEKEEEIRLRMLGGAGIKVVGSQEAL